MLRSVVKVCCVFLAALTPYLTHAMTDEQKAAIHAHFEAVGADCIKDFPIPEDDITNFRNKKMGTSENAACFTACIMKKIGVMDDTGMLQKETDMNMVKKVFNDPDEVKAAEDYLKSCNHVNTAAVGDGEKGCERAALAFDCIIQNAGKFGFDM